MMQRAKWASARIVFLIMAFAGTASGGMLVYLLGPVYSWYFFNDTNFLKRHRLILPLAVSHLKLIIEWIRNPDYRRMFTIPLTAPPMTSPDMSRVRTRTAWLGDASDCNGCVQCCIKRSCSFLDSEKNQCTCYGSFFWLYFNCGRYPENVEQIEYYECPKWEVIG
jgi:hypothetical protein